MLRFLFCLFVCLFFSFIGTAVQDSPMEVAALLLLLCVI